MSLIQDVEILKRQKQEGEKDKARKDAEEADVDPEFSLLVAGLEERDESFSKWVERFRNVDGFDEDVFFEAFYCFVSSLTDEVDIDRMHSALQAPWVRKKATPKLVQVRYKYVQVFGNKKEVALISELGTQSWECVCHSISKTF